MRDAHDLSGFPDRCVFQEKGHVQPIAVRLSGSTFEPSRRIESCARAHFADIRLRCRNSETACKPFRTTADLCCSCVHFRAADNPLGADRFARHLPIATPWLRACRVGAGDEVIMSIGGARLARSAFAVSHVPKQGETARP